MHDLIVKFIVVPMLAVIGIYIVGEMIQALFGIPEAGKVLFWAVGGIGFFAVYFKTLMSEG